MVNFKKWVEKFTIDSLSEKIVAINFNLYETDDDELFHAQLVACDCYDADDDDWACNPIFSSEEDIYEFKGEDWEEALKEGPAPGSNYQAHHGLPWEHKDYFGKAGLNVNDPKWGRWVKGGGNGGHQSWSKRYGNIWTTYKEAHPNPNADDIIDFFYKLNGGR